MKRLLVLLALVTAASIAYSATVQPSAIGVVKAILETKTLAQVDAYTPDAAGQLVYCSNCTRSLICVSSGTGRGAWTVGVATGTFVGGIQDCQ